ncbi:hypothetical protein DXX99_02320 [Ammonifex thiophilus]|uniref:Uncharacterized protein n=1 Tax=Ammonifex thiophilus TaxID=444093 RepID=A0A3D8P8K8_9THEO|nr:hypothetical protein DXX99_02320 [Ammonifex thiophilus]
MVQALKDLKDPPYCFTEYERRQARKSAVKFFDNARIEGSYENLLLKVAFPEIDPDALWQKLQKFVPTQVVNTGYFCFVCGRPVPPGEIICPSCQPQSVGSVIP